MEILYATEYYGRELYAVLIDDKVALVYKSSGLSQTGHEGLFIPFSGILSNGYILKEFYYKGQYLDHRKTVNNTTNILVARIKEFIEKEKPFLTPCPNPSDVNDEVIRGIRTELNSIVAEYGAYDYYCGTNE